MMIGFVSCLTSALLGLGLGSDLHSGMEMIISQEVANHVMIMYLHFGPPAVSYRFIDKVIPTNMIVNAACVTAA